MVKEVLCLIDTTQFRKVAQGKKIFSGVRKKLRADDHYYDSIICPFEIQMLDSAWLQYRLPKAVCCS
ncbi:hypothetical protein D770_24230 [Flammeovirgaceae bacterium 311]|nr:hypothetical protein D770_24230 [Flammeovirgaceae bacterium 311]